MHLPVNLKCLSLYLWSVYWNCGMLSKIYFSSSTTCASKTFLRIKTGTRIVFYTGGYRCLRNKKVLYFIQGGSDGVRSGFQEWSTKKKVSVLIINSLSSIHCTGAGYFFLRPREGNMRRGGDSSPFLPSRVLEISSLALKNKPAPATRANIALTFVLLSAYRYLPFRLYTAVFFALTLVVGYSSVIKPKQIW